MIEFLKEIFLSSWGIGSIVVAAILFVIYIFFFAWKIRNINKEIETVINSQDINAAFEETKLLKAVWKNFEKTLTRTDEKIYSTTDAAEFFNPQNLTSGMNMNFWQAYGGIFTGLGILGTFAGLTFGLSGVDMTSGDIEKLKGGIAQLLSGVESAFVTSLVGIGAALVYSVAHHFLVKNFQSNVQRLAEEIDKKFPRRSAEDWLKENYSEAQNQTTELKNIGGQVATENSWLEKNNVEAQNQTTELQTISTDIKNIGEDVAQAIYDGLDEKLGTYVDKICAAIEKLSSGGAEKVGEIFTKGVGSQMERFSTALDNFSNSIDEKLETANEISKIMNEQLLNTLKSLDETLKQHAQTSAAERDAEYKKFSAALESLISTLNEVADKIKTQQENSAKDFETLVTNALDNFNAVMAQMLKDAEANRQKENQQRQDDFDKNKQTNEQFLATLAGLTETLQGVAKKIEEQQAGSLNNFDALIKNLIEKLDKFTDQQKEFLETVATSNAAQISQAVKNFREIVDAHNETTKKMFAQVQSQLEETETFLELMDDASNSLKEAAEPVKQSTQQLTKNLSETSTQLNNLATANKMTSETISDLSLELDTFMENFNGIASEFERSAKIIHESLDNYNVKTNAGLREKLEAFDKSLSNAFGYLNEITEELSNAIDDLKQIRRR